MVSRVRYEHAGSGCRNAQEWPHRDIYGCATRGLTAIIAGFAPQARYFLVATIKYPKKRSPVARRAKDARFPPLLTQPGLCCTGCTNAAERMDARERPQLARSPTAPRAQTV